MNAAHIHLMVNHLPVWGTIFSIALLLLALISKNNQFQKVALAFFVAVALGGIAVYWSGDEAADQIKLLPGIATPSIHRHEEAGEAAFISLLILGAACLLSLVFYRGARSVPRGVALGILLLSLVALALVSRAAWIGGHIRHPEIWGSSDSGREGSAP